MCYYNPLEGSECMQINRNDLHVGLLTKTSTFTLAYPRKILFTYNMIDGIGYDVMNNIEYDVHQKRKNDKGYYISCIRSLDRLLENLGYPEKLEDVHLQRIMNEDFGSIFVSSAIMNDLYKQNMEELTDVHTINDFKLLKREFTITEDEQKSRGNKQMTKRRWF